MSYPPRGDFRPVGTAGAANTLPLPTADEPSAADCDFLLGLQYQALHYFLDNQTAGGLVLDRQGNRGPLRTEGLCSVAATGMGFIALALASVPPYRLLSPLTAAERIAAGLRAALEKLPHDHGILPHFVDADNGTVYGADAFSTVETAWLLAGGLWSAAFLGDARLAELALRLYDRVDWHYWTAPDEPDASGLIRHGKDADGRFLGCSWDRLNGETAFMYVLAAGAADSVALGAASWDALRPFAGTAGGARFHSADLGLFVFQYGLDLLDLDGWMAPGPVDLWAEAAVAVGANRSVCRAAADRFATYRRYWGLSAGDGPGDGPDGYAYRAYSPAGPLDGTAHLTATLASVAHSPGEVLENLYQANGERRLPTRGRYGFSTVNLDCGFVGRDMIGIDAGAAVLALDNYLAHGRVRRVFHQLPPVARALDRLGFLPRRPALLRAS